MQGPQHRTQKATTAPLELGHPAVPLVQRRYNQVRARLIEAILHIREQADGLDSLAQAGLGSECSLAIFRLLALSISG